MKYRSVPAAINAPQIATCVVIRADERYSVLPRATRIYRRAATSEAAKTTAMEIEPIIIYIAFGASEPSYRDGHFVWISDTWNTSPSTLPTHTTLGATSKFVGLMPLYRACMTTPLWSLIAKVRRFFFAS